MFRPDSIDFQFITCVWSSEQNGKYELNEQLKFLLCGRPVVAGPDTVDAHYR